MAKVSFRSLVRARVKWLPPSGMGRCQMMRSPSVMTRLELSVPMSRATTQRFLPAASSSSSCAVVSASLFEQVVGDEVAQGQRRHLDDVDLDVDVLEVLQVAVDHVALDGEQADLGLHGEAVGDDAGADLLEVPDDLVQGEGDLLLGLEADDVGDLLFLDGRQLDEAGQAALAGHADGDHVALEGVARQELLQGLAGQLVGVGVGLAEDLGVLDVVEGGGRRPAPSTLSRRRALRAHWPRSMPQTPGCWLAMLYSLPGAAAEERRCCHAGEPTKQVGNDRDLGRN